VIRVVPRVDREEFINAGVVLYCLKLDYLDARVQLDPARLRSLAPDADLELIRSHLEAIPLICRGGAAGGPIGRLSQKERWHWLIAPRSTLVQPGPAHSGLCDHPAQALEKLMFRVVG
jgi:hypothetical protein